MESSPELVAFMEKMYRSFEAFDAEAFVDVFSPHHGTLVIGSAQEEWWEGHHDIAAMVRVQFREMPPLRLHVEGTEAWREGTVGWIASRAVMEIEGMPPVPTRSTVVLREEGAYWKVLHWHLSMPVANEEALGVEMTTSVDAILAMVENEASPITSANADGEVSIVFTDLEGSTALMETLGDQTWLDLLEWHDSSVRRQTLLFGGTVVKSQGDGFMLAFSSPGAATACAVAIENALSAGWAGVSVAVRIGIHNGNAKAESGDFFGRTVVVAARIAGSAAGGELLVSQAVQESLAGAFALGAPRSLLLKGLAGEHTAFPVMWSLRD